MKKRTAATAAILACTMMFSGCSDSILTSGTDSGTTSVENIWTAKDDDIVAWATSDSLSDEEKEYYQVKFKDFYPEYSFTIANYGLDETNSAYASYAQSYRKNIIDMLTNEKLILRKAKELGLDQLTEEEMAEVEKAYTKNLSDWYASFEKKAKTALGISTDDTSGTEDSANDEKILEKEKELFNEYIAGFGLTEDTFLMWQTNTAIQKKSTTTFLKILPYPTLRSMIISQSSKQRLSRHTKRVLQATPQTPSTKGMDTRRRTLYQIYSRRHCIFGLCRDKCRKKRERRR